MSEHRLVTTEQIWKCNVPVCNVCSS